jgi:hypothetical protein
MTKREFASIILKLFGVYTILCGLPYLQSLGWILISSATDIHNISSQLVACAGMLVSFLMAVIIGIFLLNRSDYISKVIMKDDNQVPLPCPLSAAEFQAICFSAVGVFVFLDMAIPLFTRFITDMWYLSRQYSADDPTRQAEVIKTMWQKGIVAVVTSGLAVILFFRAKGLADFWHRIQIARYVKIEDANSQSSKDAK